MLQVSKSIYSGKALILLEDAKNTSRAPRAELQKVITLYSDEKVTKALKAAETLIKKFPNEPVLFNICGACYKAKNNLEHAINCFKRALEIFEIVLKFF